jgi:hypothetical protein
MYAYWLLAGWGGNSGVAHISMLSKTQGPVGDVVLIVPTPLSIGLGEDLRGEHDVWT